MIDSFLKFSKSLCQIVIAVSTVGFTFPIIFMIPQPINPNWNQDQVQYFITISWFFFALSLGAGSILLALVIYLLGNQSGDFAVWIFRTSTWRQAVQAGLTGLFAMIVLVPFLFLSLAVMCYHIIIIIIISVHSPRLKRCLCTRLIYVFANT